LRVAYFSPLNPVKSGVSDYSEEILEYLAGYAAIDLFVDDYRPSSSWLHENFKIRNYREIYETNGSGNYDLNIYHIGNSDNHAYIWKVLQEYPGLVVLHEPIIHHFVFSQTVGNNRVYEYLRELDYCYNSRREEIVKTTLEARDENSWYEYPMIDRIVDASLGIIVHSDFAMKIVKNSNPYARVRKIPSHFAPPPVNHLRSRELVREILGFAADDFVIGSFGYITASKRIDVILKAIAKVKDEGHSIKLLIVGKTMPGCDSLRLIDELGLDNDVLVTGFVDRRTFWEYLSVPDVCVALRHPSAGETSAIVIKMMGNACPVIVSDHHAFSEFPDDCCRKIAPGGEEVEKLAEELVGLILHPDERKEIGVRAQNYIRQNHDIRDSARKYIEFALEILSGVGL